MPVNRNYAAGDLYDSNEHSLTTNRTDTTVSSRIFPCVDPADQFLRMNLRTVINDATTDRHCIALDVYGSPCTKPVTLADVYTAGQIAKNLGSGSLLQSQLEQIAKLCICKNMSLGGSHYLQAPAIVDGWRRDAKQLAAETAVGFMQTLQGQLGAPRRGLPEPGRVVDLGDGGDSDDDDDARRRLKRSREQGSGQTVSKSSTAAPRRFMEVEDGADNGGAPTQKKMKREWEGGQLLGSGLATQRHLTELSDGDDDGSASMQKKRKHEQGSGHILGRSPATSRLLPELDKAVKQGHDSQAERKQKADMMLQAVAKRHIGTAGGAPSRTTSTSSPPSEGSGTLLGKLGIKIPSIPTSYAPPPAPRPAHRSLSTAVPSGQTSTAPVTTPPSNSTKKGTGPKCFLCRELLPSLPHITSCSHPYCRSCITDLQHTAYCQGQEYAVCKMCGEEDTSVVVNWVFGYVDDSE